MFGGRVVGAKDLGDVVAKREHYRDGIAILEAALASGQVRAAAVEQVEAMLTKAKATAAELDAELGPHSEDVAIENQRQQQQQQHGGQDHEDEDDVDVEKLPPPPPPPPSGPQPQAQMDHERSNISRRTRTAAQLPLGVLLCRYKGEELRDALRVRAEGSMSGSSSRLSPPPHAVHSVEERADMPMAAPNTTTLLQQPEISRTKLSNLGFDRESLAEITLADIFARLVSVVLSMISLIHLSLACAAQTIFELSCCRAHLIVSGGPCLLS